MKKNFTFCLICTKALENKNTLFKRVGVCSNDCFLRRRTIMKEERIKKYPKKNCSVCGIEFQPTGPVHERCSQECVKAYHKNLYVDSKTDFNIFKRDGFKCIYCGKSPIEDGIKLTIEHITPILLGGKASLDNLITACSKCNQSKNGSELPIDIKKRVYEILISRNNNLSIIEISAIEKEINNMQYSHFYRSNKIKK